jgi:hypothetical protein
MARLPKPGSDDGTWGDILNTYLSVEHNANGTQKPLPQSTIIDLEDDLAGKYVKPGAGIPESDLDAGVQVKLNDGTTAPDATTSSKGIVQLAGDLDGTASAPTLGSGVVTGSKIANNTVTDANIAAGAAIAKSKLAPLDIGDADVDTISQSKITDLDSALSSKVTKGESFIDVKDYGAVGDGTTDDTTAIQAAFADAQTGDTVLFSRPESFYLINDAIQPPESGIKIIGSGRSCEIRQGTQNKAVFDLLDIDGCTVEGFLLSYVGSRPVSGTSFRGSNIYVSFAGVWTNGSRHTIRNIWVDNLAMGVVLSNWDTSTNTFQGNLFGNVVDNVETSSIDHGILFWGQTGLRISNIYSHDHIDSSAGVNPTHAIYGTDDGNNLISYDIAITNCTSINNPTGHAYQIKYIEGGVVSNLVADNCKGVWSSIDLQDVSLSNLRSLNTIASGSGGAFTLGQVSGNQRLSVNGLVVQKLASERSIDLRGDDASYANITILNSRDGSNVDDYDLIFTGKRSILRALKINGLGSGASRAVLMGGGTSEDLTLADFELDNTRGLVDVAAGTTGAVISYDPGLQRNIVVGTNYIGWLGSQGVYTINRKENTLTYTGGTLNWSVSPRPFMETVTRINVTGTNPGTIAAPIGHPAVGMRHTVLVHNSSGGTITLTWAATYSFSTASVAPNAGATSSFDFIWNGTNWVWITSGTTGPEGPEGPPGAIATGAVLVTSNDTVTVPSGVTLAKISCVGGGGSGGGGGSALSAGGVVNQAGGGGGGAASSRSQVVTVTPGQVLTATIGAGGSGGGAGGAVNGGVGGNGVSGSATTVTGTGVSVIGTGGAGGRGSAANSATSAGGGAWGTGVLLATSTVTAPGQGGPSAVNLVGQQGGSPAGLNGGGGGGGGSANTTNGGSAGNAGSLAAGGAGSGNAGGSGTVSGVAGTAAVANTGAGGGGGGGGAPTGTGGSGGDGGSGFALFEWIG